MLLIVAIPEKERKRGGISPRIPKSHLLPHLHTSTPEPTTEVTEMHLHSWDWGGGQSSPDCRTNDEEGMDSQRKIWMLFEKGKMSADGQGNQHVSTNISFEEPNSTIILNHDNIVCSLIIKTKTPRYVKQDANICYGWKKKDGYGRVLFLNFSVEHLQDYPYGISF